MEDNLTQKASDIFRAFRERGHQIYLVGGCVRDRLLWLPDVFGETYNEVHDLDFCTSAVPNQILEILNRFGTPYRIGEKFGTIGLPGGVEVTTYRTDMYTPGSRKPEVSFESTLREDLSRRDFTINAMAMDEDGEVIDFFHGMEDLKNKVIRAVGNAEERFREDPLRILRAVRLAGKLGFEITLETQAALVFARHLLHMISRERIQEELCKILLTAPQIGLKRLRLFALLEEVIAPELEALYDERSQGVHHYESLWNHTLRVVNTVKVHPLLSKDNDLLLLRLAALFHDVGKTETRSQYQVAATIHYYGHEKASARITRSVMNSLRFSGAITADVTTLVENHMRFNQYVPSSSDGTVRRLLLDTGSQFHNGIQLARADQGAHRYVSPLGLDALEERAVKLMIPGVTFQSPLDGMDLMAHYNRGAGPWIRKIKNQLREAVIEGKIASGDKGAAWEMVAKDLVDLGERS